MLIDEIRKNREKILSLAAEYGLKDVRVFGSVARREEGPDSDIDLLVNYDKESGNYFGFLDFKEKTEEILHRKIDLVFEMGLYHLLRDRILNEALPV